LFDFKKYDRQNHVSSFMTKYFRFLCKFTSWSGEAPTGNFSNVFIPPLPEEGGGILFYLCPSVQDIFCRIFLSNCWWQKSDIWSQVFLDPSDSYFLFAEERGYHKWALAHSSSCFILYKNNEHPDWMIDLKHTDSTWFSKVTQVNSL
jgi:hypothetical protein